ALAPELSEAELLRSRSGRTLLLCARQVGKSTATAFLAIREALLAPGSTVLVISPTLRQSGELLRKVLTGLNALGRPVALTGEAASSITLANKSRGLSLPGSEATVRGFSADLLIVDEAARVTDGLLAGVRPMLAATGGRFVALSSAFAKSGWFYDFWNQAGEGWHKVSVVADECPRISREFLAEERRLLGPRIFDAEYRNVWCDAIDCVFDSEAVDRAVSADVIPLFARQAAADPEFVAPTGDPRVRPLFG